ncbi:MAG: hypothetical protein ACREMV_06635, partial [Gemmatimonadales bacterium]
APAFGITIRHWLTMAHYAQARGYVLGVRAGKPAALRWIELGFPAKPPAFKKCKVDRTVGLLFARRADERMEAQRAGYPLLEAVPGAPGQFVARLEGQAPLPDGRFSLHGHPWLRVVSGLASLSSLDGLVIHPLRRLPITADYDLAAIIDTARFDYYQVFGSMVGGASFANVYSQAVSRELNRLFKSERIMHGTEAQFVREMGPEYLLAFHPDRRVEGRPTRNTLEMDHAVRDLILEYAPEAGPSLGPH